MEHSLTNMQKRYEDLVNLRLNPYSNGTLSDTKKPQGIISGIICLNPYSNGTLSDLVFYAITAMAFLS